MRRIRFNLCACSTSWPHAAAEAADSDIRRIRGVRGLTLVEVLATLVLVAIVLPAAMRGITLSLQAASQARHRQEAALLAESKLNELLVVGDPSLFTGTGTFGDDWPDYQWVTTSTLSDFGLYEVSVIVTWESRGLPRQYMMTTLVYPDATVTGTVQAQ